jgi:hypothetical protein
VLAAAFAPGAPSAPLLAGFGPETWGEEDDSEDEGAVLARRAAIDAGAASRASERIAKLRATMRAVEAAFDAGARLL